jgi:hypothetical protein
MGMGILNFVALQTFFALRLQHLLIFPAVCHIESQTSARRYTAESMPPRPVSLYRVQRSKARPLQQSAGRGGNCIPSDWMERNIFSKGQNVPYRQIVTTGARLNPLISEAYLPESM